MTKRSVLAVAVFCATISAANAQNADDVLVGSNLRIARGLFCVLTNLSPTAPLSVKMATVVDAEGAPWPASRKRPLTRSNYGMKACYLNPPKSDFTIAPGNTCYIGYWHAVLPEKNSMLTCKMFVNDRKYFRGYVNVDSVDEAGSTAIK